MSTETSTAKPDPATIEDLKIRLREAAYALSDAYAHEAQQFQVPGVEVPAAINMPLNQMILSEVHHGTLDALMRSDLIRGNQSKAAIVLGINRATLRARLTEMGMLAQGYKTNREAA